MNENDRRTINKNLPLLRDNMNWRLVTEWMQSNDVFSEENVHEVEAQGTPEDKRRKVIDIIKTRGPKAFLMFCQSLVAAKQPELAEKLGWSDAHGSGSTEATQSSSGNSSVSDIKKNSGIVAHSIRGKKIYNNCTFTDDAQRKDDCEDSLPGDVEQWFPHIVKYGLVGCLIVIVIPITVSYCWPTKIESMQSNAPVATLRKGDIDLTSNLPTLCENLESTEVITLLQSENIITQREADEIRAERVPYDRNYKLIVLIGKRGDAALRYFLKCLEDTGQLHLAELIRAKSKATSQKN